MSKEIGRRKFLKNTGQVALGVTGVALVGTEAAQAKEQAPIVKTNENFPGIEFTELKMDGGAIESTLEDGPAGFWFHAVNGQTIQAYVKELDKASYVGTRVFSENGFPITPERQTNVNTEIFRTGDYFLVAYKLGNRNSDGNRISAELLDGKETTVQASVLYAPGPVRRWNFERIGFDSRLSPTLSSDDDFRIILDFGKNRKSTDVKVFATKADASTFKGESYKDYPEGDPNNQIPSFVGRYDDSSVFVGADWPKGSLVSVQLSSQDIGTTVTHFFVKEA